MRNAIFVLAVTAFAPICLLQGSAPARADTVGWPVCLAASEEAGARCEFASINQCLVMARGGLPGTCIINPAYRANSAYAQMWAQPY
jgi:hypothetical protein